MSTATFRARWFWYLPPALLIGVACSQFWLAHSAWVSPWSGGGFGMFSTMDGRGNRHLHAYALRPGIRRELALPRALEKLVSRSLTLPSESNLHVLAAELVNVPTPDAGPLQAIEIQVWATQFAFDNLEPSGSLLRVVEVPIGRAEP